MPQKQAPLAPSCEECRLGVLRLGRLTRLSRVIQAPIQWRHQLVQISAGFDLTYQCPQPTPMLLVLSVHPSRMADVIGPHQIHFDPPVGASEYRDGFGNICHRIVAPAGSLRISSRLAVSDPGTPDVVAPQA